MSTLQGEIEISSNSYQVRKSYSYILLQCITLKFHSLHDSLKQKNNPITEMLMLSLKIWKAANISESSEIFCRQLCLYRKGWSSHNRQMLLFSGLLFTLFWKHDQKFKEVSARFVLKLVSLCILQLLFGLYIHSRKPAEQ